MKPFRSTDDRIMARLLSVLFFFAVLLPIGWLLDLLRLSRFSRKAYRTTSSWRGVRPK